MLVAWIAMLDDDDRAAAVKMSATFGDRPIPQFWDGDRLLGEAVGKSLAVDHTAWDIYLFYDAAAEWTDAGLPPPQKAIAQSMNVVIGAKGTLPARGDQSVVPEWARGKADVVGEQSELATLLTQIALPVM